jgi:hypothetical protein
MKEFNNSIKIIILAFILVVGASYLKAWTGPTLPAPSGNVSAPLNVGSSVQTKFGSLILNSALPIQNAIGLTVFGTSTLYGLTLANGTQAVNRVLVSDASGNARWMATSTLGIGGVSGGSSGVSKIIAGENIAISPTTGVGNVTITGTAGSSGVSASDAQCYGQGGGLNAPFAYPAAQCLASATYACKMVSSCSVGTTKYVVGSGSYTGCAWTCVP